MKKSRFGKKLSLNKKTISNLATKDMGAVNAGEGGQSLPLDPSCVSVCYFCILTGPRPCLGADTAPGVCESYHNISCNNCD